MACFAHLPYNLSALNLLPPLLATIIVAVPTYTIWKNTMETSITLSGNLSPEIILGNLAIAHRIISNTVPPIPT
ncbi:MAG: hypothetical protein M3227_06545 [Thermoproteota archaeon]|nr:hypothetical protein [Thermoproteota archaeon]